MTEQETERVVRDLLAAGVIRQAGIKNGEIAYELTPDSERSDEAKAFVAYLEGLDSPLSAN